MTLYIDEQTYWDSPYLLSSPRRRLYFYRNEKHEWHWQEKTGEEWAKRGALPRKNGYLCGAQEMEGTPHLVLFESGSIYHLKMEASLFFENQFYREESKKLSHPLLACDTEATLHLVYLAQDMHNSRWWLLHHRRTAGGWEEPRVIDFGGGNFVNYGDIAIDHKNNLHLLYRIAEPKQFSLYYRCFSPVSLNWSKAQQTASGFDIGYPSIAVDREKNIHTLWVDGSPSGYHVYYRAMIQGGWPAGGWKPAVTISPTLDHKVFTFFSPHLEDLLMVWLDKDTLYRFRYHNRSWEKMQPLPVEDGSLSRHCSAGVQGSPASFWTLTRGGVPLTMAEDPPAATELFTENLKPQFERLQQYSEALVHRASSLSTDKSRLEQAMEEKRKELSWVSQQNKKKVQALQQSLAEKDKELHGLEEKFNLAVTGLKQKMEQTRKSWEEEKKRYLGEQQSARDEHRRFDLTLKEKENTIDTLERRIKEQEQKIKELTAEKEALAAKPAFKGWNIKKFLAKLLQNKPYH